MAAETTDLAVNGPSSSSLTLHEIIVEEIERAAVHYAVRNHGDFPRLLERILIADEPLYADI